MYHQALGSWSFHVASLPIFSSKTGASYTSSKLLLMSFYWSNYILKSQKKLTQASDMSFIFIQLFPSFWMAQASLAKKVVTNLNGSWHISYLGDVNAKGMIWYKWCIPIRQHIKLGSTPGTGPISPGTSPVTGSNCFFYFYFLASFHAFSNLSTYQYIDTWYASGTVWVRCLILKTLVNAHYKIILWKMMLLQILETNWINLIKKSPLFMSLDLRTIKINGKKDAVGKMLLNGTNI